MGAESKKLLKENEEKLQRAKNERGVTNEQLEELQGRNSRLEKDVEQLRADLERSQKVAKQKDAANAHDLNDKSAEITELQRKLSECRAEQEELEQTIAELNVIRDRLDEKISKCRAGQEKWEKAARPMVDMNTKFKSDATFFQKFTILYSVRAGTMYAPVAWRRVEPCIPKQKKEQSWDTYIEYIDCLETKVADDEAYVMEYAYHNEEVLFRRILLNYLQGILRVDGLFNLTNAAEKMQHLMQVTVLDMCPDLLTSSEVLHCMVCQWYKYDEFGKFTNIANEAAKTTREQYRTETNNDNRIMPGLKWDSAYRVYDMDGLWTNFVKKPLDVTGWKQKCVGTTKLEDTYFDLRAKYPKVEKLFQDDINSYSLKRLKAMMKANRLSDPIPQNIYKVLTDTGKKRAFMYVLLNYGMELEWTFTNPIAVENCYRNGPTGNGWLVPV